MRVRFSVVRLLLPLVVLAMFVVSGTTALASGSGGTTSGECDPALLSGDITIGTDSASATVRYASTATGSCEVGMASYMKFDEVIANQAIFDWDTRTIMPGEEITLEVDLPECAAQIDLFHGDVIFTFPPYYGDRKLDYVHVGGTNYCDLGCTLTPGFWKNHPEAWPVTGLEIGGTWYTQAELLDILNTAVRGNGWVSLMHHVIAAKLNALNGTASYTVHGDIAAAEALIAGATDAYLHPSVTSNLVNRLTMYNEGKLGPVSCG